MQSKGNAPTAAQKRWREAVRELGSVISGGPAVIHHCVGATAKHNKVAIGHEWIIPLTDDEHKDLHAGETYGYESRKAFEKWMIIAVSDNLRDHKDKPSQSVMDAIKDYHL